uniref:Uncharacterized protein n=1 Tax=Amphimedon queenslandica TaxID=400682 RepID=A0A1X7V0I9_AMPQE
MVTLTRRNLSLWNLMKCFLLFFTVSIVLSGRTILKCCNYRTRQGIMEY